MSQTMRCTTTRQQLQWSFTAAGASRYCHLCFFRQAPYLGASPERVRAPARELPIDEQDRPSKHKATPGEEMIDADATNDVYGVSSSNLDHGLSSTSVAAVPIASHFVGTAEGKSAAERVQEANSLPNEPLSANWLH